MRKVVETRDLHAIAIGESAARHGGELLALGFSVSQVVHAYGDICQAITKIALAKDVPISVGEFQILNRSLDDAIAGALTEHARLTLRSGSIARRRQRTVDDEGAACATSSIEADSQAGKTAKRKP